MSLSNNFNQNLKRKSIGRRLLKNLSRDENKLFNKISRKTDPFLLIVHYF